MLSKHNLILRLIIIIAAMLGSTTVFATSITVTTDRDPAVLNESFVMTFKSDGSVDGAPDFSPLNKNFKILSTGQSSNMSIINGQVSSSKSWTLNVIARHTGRLRIPAIAFGGDRSTPSTVTVVRAAPGTLAHSNQNIFLEVNATPKDPYVQSEVIYTLKLFRSVSTANASLNDPPEVTGAATAVVERIGQDKSYETRRNGKIYDVVERKYAIYPQGSGTLTIKPVTFQGQITDGMSFFSDPFGQPPRTVMVQSDPITLNVRGIPKSFTGDNWLPAKGITLTEAWSQYPLKFKINEPLTRTVTLTAKGLTSSQLPALPKWHSADFNQYPDQPVLKDDKQETGVVGKRIEKIAMIPNRDGTYTLPEIDIPWWNTVKDKMETATLPKRTIEVVGPAGQSGKRLDLSPPPVKNLALPKVKIKPDQSHKTQVASKPAASRSNRLPDNLWEWLCLLLFIFWIFTLIVWRYTKRRSAKNLAENNGHTTSHRMLLKELKQACLDNNPTGAKERLMLWGRMNWPDRPPVSLGEIANRCTDALAVELRLLNNALYSRAGSDWQGRELWRALEQELKRMETRPEKNKGKLEPLFRI